MEQHVAEVKGGDEELEINGNSHHLRLAVFFSCIGGFLFG